MRRMTGHYLHHSPKPTTVDNANDRMALTLTAASLSFLLALPWVLALSAVALLLKEGNSLFAALSSGFTGAAFVTLLLRTLHSVARPSGAWPDRQGGRAQAASAPGACKSRSACRLAAS